MPVKKRVPKGRAHKITPDAVAAFKAGEYLALHLALDLRPWECSPLDVDQGPPPDYAVPGWEQAKEIRREIERETKR